MIVERRIPEFHDAGAVLVWWLLALGGVVLIAVAIAAGPVVRRIRKLQREVYASARTRYASEVEATGSDEIADLARAFNAAGREVREYLTELEAREKTLRAFVADTTHDVMIPLTVLRGHLATLRRRTESGEPADGGMIRSALEETHYMASLVSNLSAAAKLESGAGRDLRRDTVDLCALVERVHGRHAPLAAIGGVAIDRAVPAGIVTTTGDVTLIEQALSNLVHNAVRYNREGGHVAILLDSSNGRFELRVSDDGPGVSEELLRRLPERSFRSSEARSRAPDGLGLGLAIARDVAERHGFELEFHRREEGGLEATLRGPAKRAGPHSGLPVVEQS